jgi:hypothetical protein
MPKQQAVAMSRSIVVTVSAWQGKRSPRTAEHDSRAQHILTTTELPESRTERMGNCWHLPYLWRITCWKRHALLHWERRAGKKLRSVGLTASAK